MIQHQWYKLLTTRTIIFSYLNLKQKIKTEIISQVKIRNVAECRNFVFKIFCFPDLSRTNKEFYFLFEIRISVLVILFKLRYTYYIHVIILLSNTTVLATQNCLLLKRVTRENECWERLTRYWIAGNLPEWIIKFKKRSNDG